MLTRTASLRAVKVVHTIAWAFFASCIVAIPVFAWQRQFVRVAILTAVLLVEIGVLIVNGWRCPLTGIAARYTEDRSDNFDIYLPLWLARYNKLIFGSLLVAGLIFTLARLQGWIP